MKEGRKEKANGTREGEGETARRSSARLFRFRERRNYALLAPSRPTRRAGSNFLYVSLYLSFQLFVSRLHRSRSRVCVYHACQDDWESERRRGIPESSPRYASGIAGSKPAGFFFHARAAITSDKIRTRTSCAETREFSSKWRILSIRFGFAKPSERRRWYFKAFFSLIIVRGRQSAL